MLSAEPVVADRLELAIGQWAKAACVPGSWLPSLETVRERLPNGNRVLRSPASVQMLDDWESRHGFTLPKGLRAWLSLSNGFYPVNGPAIHPISAIGPMVPFARVPGLLVQPESWFELGNPNEAETICIDLAYRWLPGGDAPIFTSGDDLTGNPPRLIAPSFQTWMARLLREGGRPYWLDPGFDGLGDPWGEHRLRAPTPLLPDRLEPLLGRLQQPINPELDDFALASLLEISRPDAEALLRHLQHARPPLNGVR